MIDLTAARRAMDDAQELLDDLDGLEISDERAITQSPKTKLREERARASKDLLLLVSRLKMAASLTENAYWIFKGEPDILEEPEPEHVS